MSVYSQRSLAAGEISPDVQSRVDTTRYQQGLSSLYNAYVMRHGGVSNRGGTSYVLRAKYDDKQTRLIDFVFNDSNTYTLEFGHQYIRIHTGGQTLLQTAKNITNISKANPGVVTTSASHFYSNGDWVYLYNIGGMEELNTRWAKVAGVTSTTFQLTDLDGNNIDTSSLTTYSSGGFVAKIYEVATSYDESDVFEIKYTQSGDVVDLAHNGYEPQKFIRYSSTDFSIEDMIDRLADKFGNDIGPNAKAIHSTSGAFSYRYKITSIFDETLEESPPNARGKDIGVASIALTNPCTVTTSEEHGFYTGDSIVAGYQFSTIYVGDISSITRVNATQFTFPVDNTSGGVSMNANIYKSYIEASACADRKSTAINTSSPIQLVWGNIAGVKEFNVYLEVDGIWAHLGVANVIEGTSTVTFDDIGQDPDLSVTFSTDRSVASGSGSYPGVVGIVQQRKVLAATISEPERIILSDVGYYSKFSYRNPIKDGDSISFVMSGSDTVNEVRHILDLGNMVVLTAGGEWACLGDSSGIITPSSVNPKQYGYNGSSHLRPIKIGESALFVQARGSIVRDLGFNINTDGYAGNDLTIFSSHLVDDYTLVDWCYQKTPHSIVWAVRDDGKVIGLTYVKEQQIIGWHRHDFGGDVKSITSVPEGTEDFVYIVVDRVIDGSTKRYIERMNTRKIRDIEDTVLMDSSKTYNGVNSNASVTVTLTGGTDWTNGEELTITSSASLFKSSDVGNTEIHVEESDGTYLRLSITSYSSATSVKGIPDKTVEVSLRSTATSSWARASKTYSKLWHLEGETISAFGDGFVVASPNNQAYPTYQVENGSVTFPEAYRKMHIGLPFVSDVETLDIDTVQSETLMDKKILVKEVIYRVDKTRGLFAGMDVPTGSNMVEGLTEQMSRSTESYDQPPQLQSGIKKLKIGGDYDSRGRVLFRQVDPLPFKISSISPKGDFPGGSS